MFPFKRYRKKQETDKKIEQEHAQLVNRMISDIDTIKSLHKDTSKDSRLPFTVEKKTISIGMVGSQAELKSSLRAGDEIINIMGDFTIHSPICIGYPVTIHGGGHTIKRAEDFNRIMFQVRTYGKLTLQDIIIDGNKENKRTTGELVYVNSGALLYIMDGTILQNNCERGVRIYHGGTAFMYGGEIKNNKAKHKYYHNTYGGGVLNSGCFKMSGGVIRNNLAEYGGGVCSHWYQTRVFKGSPTFTMSSNSLTASDPLPQIISNESFRGGGGVFNDSVCLFVMKDGKIADNQSKIGGGVEDLGMFIMNGGKISGNRVIGQNSRGGGVSICRRSSFEMNAGEIYGNETEAGCACTYGGGVNQSGGTFTMGQQAKIYENRAQYGGGISSSGVFNMISGAKIMRNTAQNGAGVHLRGPGIFTMGKIGDDGHCEIFQNHVVGDGVHYGGGVCNEHGTFIMNSGSIYEHIPQAEMLLEGGGVYNLGLIQDSGVLEGSFIMKGGMIRSNTAAHGGGVYNAGSAVFTMASEKAKILNNMASKGGGGVYNNYYCKRGTVMCSAAFHMLNGEISENRSKEGGGIYNDNYAKIYLGGSSGISDNEAETDGGGVYNNQGAVLILESTDVQITNNQAKEGEGGGIYNNGMLKKETIVSMKNGQITNNESGGNGGGVSNVGSDAVFHMHSSSLISNNCTGKAGCGGGVNNLKKAVFNMDGSTLICNNKAGSDGGGIYNIEGGKIALSGSAMVVGSAYTDLEVYNVAGGNGPGIYNDALLFLKGSPKVNGSSDGLFLTSEEHVPTISLAMNRDAVILLDKNTYISPSPLGNEIVIANADSETYPVLTETDSRVFLKPTEGFEEYEVRLNASNRQIVLVPILKK